MQTARQKCRRHISNVDGTSAMRMALLKTNGTSAIRMARQQCKRHARNADSVSVVEIGFPAFVDVSVKIT